MIRRRNVLAGFAAAPFLAGTARAQGAEFTLLLDWFVNPNHGPIIVAQELGHFRNAGLNVRIVPPSDPNDPPRLIAAGRGDVAVSYPHTQIFQASQDIPALRIGALIDSPLSTVTVLADGPIKTLSDFRGRKIGYSISGVELALLRTMLASAGVPAGAYETVNVNFALSPALLTKRVDGVIGAFRNFELFQLEIEGSKGRAFLLEEHGIPMHDALIFAAQRDRARSRDPKLRAFLDAVARGAADVAANPDAAWNLFIKGRANLDNELNRRAWKATVPLYARNPAALDPARELAFAEFMAKNGLIATVPPLDKIAVAL
jgi:putative hydroxymethylpyrimidine transport system substrate-binding protein